MTFIYTSTSHKSVCVARALAMGGRGGIDGIDASPYMHRTHTHQLTAYHDLHSLSVPSLVSLGIVFAGNDSSKYLKTPSML